MPALVTHTVSALAVTMEPTVQVTQLPGTGLPYPALVTVTHSTIHVPGPVTGAVGLASQLLIVHLVAGLSPPALATDAGAGHTVAMASTPGINTVN